MAEKWNTATWRDAVSERLGSIERGVADLGHNFDEFKKTFDGNGQPGRCALEQSARTMLAERVRALEDARERRVWVGAAAGVVRAVLSVILAAILIGLLRYYFHWL